MASGVGLVGHFPTLQCNFLSRKNKYISVKYILQHPTYTKICGIFTPGGPWLRGDAGLERGEGPGLKSGVLPWRAEEILEWRLKVLFNVVRSLPTG